MHFAIRFVVIPFVIWFVVAERGLATGQTMPDQVAQPQSSSPPASKSPRLQFDPTPAAVTTTPRAIETSEENFEFTAATGQNQSDSNDNRSEFVIAPFPISNPALGSGLVVVTGYLFPLSSSDRVSPLSMVGGGAFYTSNGSWVWGTGAKLHLRQDRIRVTSAYGQAQLRYDLYGIGNAAGNQGLSVRVDQGGKALLLESLIGLRWKMFLGPRYQWRSLNAILNGAKLPPGFNIPAGELKSTTSALGFHIQRDVRDHQFYPKAGTLTDVVADFFQGTLGSDFAYQSYTLAFNKYSGISPRQVLAFRIFGCATSGRVPFYDLCLLGMHNDVRGYKTGQYRDRLMLTSQLEYRLELPKRFGLVGFFGVGEVGPKIGEFSIDNLKPAGGGGVRFTLAKKNHVNLRVDYATGLQGGGVYLGVTEAF